MSDPPLGSDRSCTHRVSPRSNGRKEPVLLVIGPEIEERRADDAQAHAQRAVRALEATELVDEGVHVGAGVSSCPP